MKTETGKKAEKLVKLFDKLISDFRDDTTKIIETLSEIKEKEKEDEKKEKEKGEEDG